MKTSSKKTKQLNLFVRVCVGEFIEQIHQQKKILKTPYE
jgi:hypothetical protein